MTTLFVFIHYKTAVFTCLNIHFQYVLSPNRGPLEILQLDFVPKDVSEQIESQAISWRLELPGNVKDVGLMRIFTTRRDYMGLAPLVMVRTMLASVQQTAAVQDFFTDQ